MQMQIQIQMQIQMQLQLQLLHMEIEVEMGESGGEREMQFMSKAKRVVSDKCQIKLPQIECVANKRIKRIAPLSNSTIELINWITAQLGRQLNDVCAKCRHEEAVEAEVDKATHVETTPRRRSWTKV